MRYVPRDGEPKSLRGAWITEPEPDPEPEPVEVEPEEDF
jgi:hypothetical protein